MMDLRELQDLRECQSLDQTIKDHLNKIEEHQKRVTNLEKQRTKRKISHGERVEQLTTLKCELIKEEKSSHQLSTQIEKATQRLSSMTTDQQIKATEREIGTLSPQIEDLENKILEKMEQIELLEEEISDDQTFIEGSKRSLDEITLEVEDDIKKEEREIKQYQTRIDNLLANCSDNFTQAFIQLNKRYRFKNPITRITNGSCASCGIIISPQQRDNIEKNDGPHFCGNCGRLLFPYNSF